MTPIPTLQNFPKNSRFTRQSNDLMEQFLPNLAIGLPRIAALWTEKLLQSSNSSWLPKCQSSSLRGWVTRTKNQKSHYGNTVSCSSRRPVNLGLTPSEVDLSEFARKTLLFLKEASQSTNYQNWSKSTAWFMIKFAPKRRHPWAASLNLYLTATVLPQDMYSTSFLLNPSTSMPWVSSLSNSWGAITWKTNKTPKLRWLSIRPSSNR